MLLRSPKPSQTDKKIHNNIDKDSAYQTPLHSDIEHYQEATELEGQLEELLQYSYFQNMESV